MKRVISKRKLRQLIIGEIDVLLEQEDELFGDEEEVEEEEPAEEGGEDEGGEDEGGDEEEGAEEGEEEGEPEGEEGLPLGKSVDNDLNALFVDFETQALKVGEEQAQVVQPNEGKKKSLSYLLFEQEEEEVEEEEPAEEGEEAEAVAEEIAEVPIDMETFASNVARLAMNYDSLMDMEDLILVKAQDYIKVKHSEEKADELMDILDLRYQLSLEEEEPIVAPIAVGASTTAAGAA